MSDLHRLGDDALEAELTRLAGEERRLHARLLPLLAEFDVRGLPLAAGTSGLYDYCLRELGYAEGAAYERVKAAGAALRFPVVLERIKDGRLTMAAAALLSPLLLEENVEDILAEAEGKSRQELELLAASLDPRADVQDRIVELPGSDGKAAAGGDGPDAACEAGADSARKAGCARDQAAVARAARSEERRRRDRIEALSAERVHFGFTGSLELRRKLERARALLWHKDPSGRLEGIIDGLADYYLDRKDPQHTLGLDARRPAEAAPPSAAGRGTAGEREAGSPRADWKPAARSRVIPQAVKDEVWRRDEGRCSYAAPDGRRCEARAGLEYDHIVPWVFGGRSDAAVNIRLLCRAHNQWAARREGLNRPS